MNNDMTIDEIEKLLSEITPGEWEWEYGVSKRTAWGLMSGDRYVLKFATPNDIKECPNPEIDMDFIAVAPQIIRYLLKELETEKKVSRWLAESMQDCAKPEVVNCNKCGEECISCWLEKAREEINAK